ncbi:MAG: tyrosine-type recombinase/integrase [Verrucomicrobiia bacterium]
MRVAGTPPASLSLRDEGDKAFERSRAQALERLNQTIAESKQKNDSAHLVERIYEIKTGERIRTVALASLPAEWQRIPRRRKPNERYAAQCRSTLARFVAFIREQNPKAEEMAHVTRDVARAFMEAESSRGVTAKTWNDTLKLLRATFKHLLPAGSINPFSNVPTRETETVFRMPFTPEELKAIVDTARDDDFIRPILVIGMCTAMRRGDCCLLKWKDVDLARRFITVKTAKTGATVSIPIFPMLYDELTALATMRGSSAVKPSETYVFPEQAQMYLENPDGITWRVRKVFAAAGFKDAGGEGELDDRDSKRESALLRRSSQNVEGVEVRGEIHADRKEGLRRASVRDFHSFRVTWVTVALTGGVPLELVQKVTGHKTTEIVLKHYFQPGREAFRQALQTAMPKLLTNGQKAPKDQMLEILSRTTAKTWQKDSERLRKLVAAL